MNHVLHRRDALKLAGAALVGGALAGCSSGSNSSDNGTSDAVTLNVYLPAFATTPSPGDSAVFAAANKIIKQKINATVNFHVIAETDYNTKMPTQLASGGSDIDLIQAADWLFGYTTQAEQGAFAPLDDLLTKHGHAIVAAEGKSVVNSSRIKGKIYAVTGLQLLTLQPSWSVQKRVLDASGVKGTLSNGVFLPSGANPYSIDVIAPILAGAKKNLTGTSKNFTLLGYPGTWGLQAGFNPMSYGLWPINPSIHTQYPFYVKMGTTQVTMGLDELRTYATMMRSFYTAGYMKSDAGTNAQPPTAAPGDVGATLDWTGGGALENFGTPTAGTPADEANIEIPLSPAPYFMGFNIGWAIPASSKNPDRAMMLLNLLFTDKELVTLLSYGFEGKDYTVAKDTITPKSNATYTHGTSCWVWGNCFITPTWPYADTSSLAGPQFWPDVDRLLKAAVVSPLSTFVFDETPVSSQWAALTSATTAYDLPLFTGAVPTDAQFSKYSNALTTAGSAAILKEVQSQLDAYVKQYPQQKQMLLQTTSDKLLGMAPDVAGQGSK